MSNKLRWGVLGAAKIGQKKVIPAMQAGDYCDIRAIASRDKAKAQKAASELGIPLSYGSYEELLEDSNIDAVYIPLPNHLHVEWSRKALKAGKHVLCEKPLSLSVEDVDELIRLRDTTGLKIAEAFMVDVHPQWVEARERVRRGDIGQLRAIQGFFSYNNPDPDNIRNKYKEGGGGMWDIGCYPVHTARYMFEEEPESGCAVMENDPKTGIDYFASALMRFPSGTLTFSASTRLAPYQEMTFFGTEGRLSIHIPFNQDPNTPSLLYYDGTGKVPPQPEAIELPTADQYMLQGDAFSRAVLEDEEVPVSLENTRGNTSALLSLFRSSATGKCEKVE